MPPKKKAKKKTAKSAAPAGTHLAGIILGNASGYHPDHLALWNIIGVFPSPNKAVHEAGKVADTTGKKCFIAPFKEGEAHTKSYEAPWTWPDAGFVHPTTT